MAEENIEVEVEVKSESSEAKQESKEDQLKKLLKDGKPYVRKYDGVAVKVEEDKEIVYKDYDNNDNVLKVPAGSYVVIGSDKWCEPKIITAEDFEKKNRFVDESAPKVKAEKSSKYGIDLIG